MMSEFNFEYRPKSYFGPKQLDNFYSSRIRNEAARKAIDLYAAAGAPEQVKQIIDYDRDSGGDYRFLEKVHPHNMGGSYLPELDGAEVEIGRISINSTTNDVTCMYASFEEGKIHYHVVDEYGGETLGAVSECTSTRPLTFLEFTDFFLNAWNLLDCLEWNFEDDLDGALGFFSATSEFYPEFDDLCRLRAVENHGQLYPASDDDEEK